MNYGGSMSKTRIYRKFHKWFGIVIGIQVLAWTTGGFVMSYFPIQKVRGEHNINNSPEKPLTQADIGYPIENILTMQDGRPGIVQLTLKRSLGRPVYEVLTEDGTLSMLDATTGNVLSPLSKEAALAYAQNDFSGEGSPISVELLTETNLEYRKEVPVWRIDFDDKDKTHIYVSPRNGSILARRNRTWRLYDFFWMLHIMDYKNRTNFNHPLLVGAAVIAITLVLSGIILIFKRFTIRDFRFIKAATWK
jgi:uncharacterized membrane protein YkoI